MTEEERIQKLLSCNECKFATCEQCEISYTDKKLIKEYISEKDKIIDLMAEQLAGLTIFDIVKDEPLILSDKEDVKQYFANKTKEK